jgi:predicted dehydrogenase
MENIQLRVGVIGLGIGKSHAKGVQATEGALLYALCDTDEKKLQSLARELNVANTFTDYRDLIADPNVDAVIIASPDQDHRKMILDTLDAGKHILCEKPVALTREDCEAIVAAVEKSDRKFMVGQVCRFTPGFKQAKEIIESGAIGELTFVESEYAHDYTAIYAKGSWRSDPVRNGVVGGGCHAVDLLRWIAGDPEEIMAYGVHKTFADVTPYDDTHVAIMKFPGGVIGKVFVSISCKRDYTMRSVFYGTKGTIIVDNTSPTMTLYRDLTYSASGGAAKTKYLPTEIPVSINSHNMTAEIEDICNVILNDVPIECDVIAGANTVAVCQAAVKSAATGQPCAPEYFSW